MALEFSFALHEDEPIRARVVRCAQMSLSMGTMGFGLNGDWYASFINCQKKPAGRVGQFPAESIASWTTSCALYVRAILYWCGKTTGVAVNGSGIFTYLGNVSYAHPAWTKFTGKEAVVPKPFPGAIFYVASHPQANDGHVGIFLREVEPGIWETAEGGGSAPGGRAGTTCKKSMRTLKPGVRFDPWRVLLGWFDPEKMDLPKSPPRATYIDGAEFDDEPTPVNFVVPFHPGALPSVPDITLAEQVVVPPPLPPPLPNTPPVPVGAIEPPVPKSTHHALLGVALSSLVAAVLSAIVSLMEHCNK